MKCNVLNALSSAKFLTGASMRGAFYGTAVGCRNAASEAEVWEATLGFRRVLCGSRAAEAGAAALGVGDIRGPSEAEGREAGTGRER